MKRKTHSKKNTDFQENTIHIKLDPSENIKAKKDFLTSQLSLLQILTHLTNYKKYRMLELEKKMEAKKMLTLTTTSITKIERVLPKIKIPKLLQKEEKEIKKPVEEKPIKKESIKKEEQKIKPVEKPNTIEAQLIEIQNRLRSLE